jgi:iron complex outermembrane receptor protein
VSAPEQEKRARDYGVFGSVNYRIPALPKLTLSAGLRYDATRLATRQYEGVLDLGLGGLIFYRDASLDAHDDALLPRVSARYELTDDLTFFAVVAKGYIPGGFNLAAVQEGISDSNILRYDAETLWSYEAGFKVRSADRRWSGSAAVFYIRSDNWQEIRVLADEQGRPVSSDFIGSSASMDSSGFELEGRFQPVEACELIANFGYADAKYRTLIDPSGSLAGNRVKLVPEYDAMLAARYEWSGGFFTRLEAAFTGEIELDERNRAAQEATTVLGVQVGYETERYAVRLFGENLTDERRHNGLAFDNLGFGTDGTYYAPLDAPRIVGIEMEAKF